jgi:hypothetical protein
MLKATAYLVLAVTLAYAVIGYAALSQSEHARAAVESRMLNSGV